MSFKSYVSSEISSAQAELDAALMDAESDEGGQEPLFPLHPQFMGEDIPYLTAIEAQQYSLRVDQHGRLVDPSSKPFADDRAMEGMYVVDRLGTVLLYLPGTDDLRQLRHSSLVAGETVMAAGQIVVHNGRVLELSNESGHYTPSPSSLQGVMRRLAQQGVTHLDGVALNAIHSEAYDISHAAFTSSESHGGMGMHWRGRAARLPREAGERSSSKPDLGAEDASDCLMVGGLSAAQRVRTHMPAWCRLALVPWIIAWPIMRQLNVEEWIYPFGEWVYLLLMSIYTLTLFFGCLAISPELAPCAAARAPRSRLRPATERRTLTTTTCPQPITTVLYVAILSTVAQTAMVCSRTADSHFSLTASKVSAAEFAIRVGMPASAALSLICIGVAAHFQRLSVWQVFRTAVVASAATRLVGCLVLMACFGPQGGFPPGNISFLGAMACWCVHLMGGVLSGPQARVYCEEALTVISLTHGVTVGAHNIT